nr:replication initiator protein A [Fusobacterium nucleatum]
MKDNEPFYQVPKSLFRLRREGGISLTAFDIYILMMDRYKISCLKENIKSFTDTEGEIYFLYAYNSLMEDLNTTKRDGISKAIQELETLGLIKSKKVFGVATKYYMTSNQKGTSTSNQKGTSTSNQKGTLIIINNKNNINKNNTNNNKENVAAVIRQEIKFLIKTRNIKIDNVLKYCSDLNRIKEVFLYADKNNKSDGWVIACLRDNYSINQKEENQEKEKDYSKTMDEILRGG